jgi:hypothetical protein
MRRPRAAFSSYPLLVRYRAFLLVAAGPLCSSPPVLTRFKRSAGGGIVALNAF